VLFDIYGTLFHSAAGDIENSQVWGKGEGEKTAALDALAREYTGKPCGEELRQYFRSAVLNIHRERSSQTPFPEVRVEEIWADFLKSRAGSGESPAALSGKSLDEAAEELALRFELAVNPVYPMPGAEETIRGLKKAGYILGLISNAQFFTPLLFEAFFDRPPEALGFEPALLLYSFETGEAKPSPRLFSLALERLAAWGIGAENCLYVGNDMRNDIYGAASAGFQTVLFAGDGRSLRIREAGPENRPPSALIRRLEDLLFLPAAGQFAGKKEM
jgi:putative hydrolase of the HAD superfamily